MRSLIRLLFIQDQHFLLSNFSDIMLVPLLLSQLV